jgi:rhamnosyltransferase
LKILYVTSAFLPDSRGGTELHAFYLAREMQRLGHEVLVFTRCGDMERPDYDRDSIVVDGVPVERLNYNFQDASSFEWIYKNPNIDLQFSRLIDSFAPDLVHVHHLTCLSTSINEVVKNHDIPLVMTLHDFWMVCPRGQRIDTDLSICETVDRVKCHSCLANLWPHFFPDAPASWDPGLLPDLGEEAPESLKNWDTHIQRVLNLCDLMITPSAFHRERMLEFNLPAEKIVALPHGLDRELLGQTRDPKAPLQRIGFIGSVIPSKGVQVLVQAFDLLGDPNLELSIYGEAPNFHGDTGYVDRLKAMVTDGARVNFVGAYDQSELSTILEGIDVLVVPSLWWESFCLTIREGLLSGCAVVAADHGPMREALADGKDGLLFEPANAQDLAAKLKQLIHDRELLARMRNRGHVVKGIERCATETADLYRQAFKSAGKNSSVVDAVPLKPILAEPLDRESEVPVTVFIPTYNGGETFKRVIEGVFKQKTNFEYEVLIIDSGSTDGTLDVIAEYDVRLINIPSREFNHGLTRNRAVHEAKGDIVALLTHDAIPYDETWLECLIANFDDPEVAGAYCHQLPRDDCNPFQLDRLQDWTKGEGQKTVKQIENRAEYEAMAPMERYLKIAFDDVASCVRKSTMAKIPFERRQFGEDVAWGKQAILSGYKLVMDPSAVVIHSHNNSIWYEFKRVYLDHQNLHDLVGMHLVPRFSDVLRFTLGGTTHLGGIIRRSPISILSKIGWWIKVPFYSLGQNMGQYLGARSVMENKKGVWGWIDTRLKKGV